MSRAKVKALALIAVASGLLAFEAMVLMGAAMAMGSVCQRTTHRRLQIIRMTQDGRRARVWTSSTYRERNREVREAVEASIREAAL